MKNIYFLSGALIASLSSYAQCPDNNFSSNGLLDIGPVASSTYQTGVQVMSNGDIVAGGWTDVNAGEGDLLIVKALSNGTPDPGFGSGGVMNLDLGAHEYADALLMDGQGRILIAGQSSLQGTHDFLVARRLDTGTEDANFGTAGYMLTDFNGFEDNITALAQQSDGKVVACGYAGTTLDGLEDFAIARYLDNGTLDPSFNVTGTKTTDIGGNNGSDRAKDLAIMSDGSIVVVGTYGTNGANYKYAVVRYATDGFQMDLDTFGITTNNWVYSVDVVDDQIYIGGGSTYPTVVKLDANGEYDLSFNGTGYKQLNVGGATEGAAHDVTVQSDGKILVSGAVLVGGEAKLFVARLDPDGTFDNTFCGAGYVIHSNGAGHAEWFASAQDLSSCFNPPTCRLVTAGYHLNGGSRLGLLGRYTIGAVGVEELTATLYDLGVRPNPATDAFTLSFTLRRAGAIRISLRDVFGREVWRELDGMVYGPGSHERVIETRSLAQGSYIVSVMHDDGRVEAKLLKL